MKQAKPIVVLGVIFFFVVLLIPTLLVVPFTEKTDGKLHENVKQTPKTEKLQKVTASPLDVSVYRTETKKVEKLPLEDYLVGVVAAEMPATFELEALKAQSLAARTYIVQTMMNGNSHLPEGADVTDTVEYQVYLNKDELRSRWNKDYDWKIKKIQEAVKDTQGQILTYKNKPINATFFSTSNGYTENSEAYWKNSIPYLKSVASPWDKKSPEFTNQKVMSVASFERRLGVKLTNSGSVGEIVSRTPGQRVDYVKINGKELSGKDVREKLGLSSADFHWTKKGNEIIINTKGYGHGIGMSQYGANGMALEGKTYKDIVTHYYTGVAITPNDQFVAQLTAKR
ncbi:stage II sporulation protein D [Priestia megaterium]|jgi:stage II sporulation protein D|uniref:stage II sporulation protein D n=1 Tax=Priestia megaterium TaxID=1404 RepID=UPI0018691F90|nr:stage II sporulation protein D [Priestia megaterium]MBE2976316.1 stage II sporulation protein D [Priestia megaterium]